LHLVIQYNFVEVFEYVDFLWDEFCIEDNNGNTAFDYIFDIIVKTVWIILIRIIVGMIF
jgi:hypothetical protein